MVGEVPLFFGGQENLCYTFAAPKLGNPSKAAGWCDQFHPGWLVYIYPGWLDYTVYTSLIPIISWLVRINLMRGLYYPRYYIGDYKDPCFKTRAGSQGPRGLVQKILTVPCEFSGV